MAESKLSDAMLLLENKRWSGAYYLAGYSIEIGLKACIARQISADVLPDKKFIIDTYQHELQKLVGIAGLTHDLNNKKNEIEFQTNWGLVAQWTPESRYSAVDPYSSQALISAISDSKSGVLPWIKKHW